MYYLKYYPDFYNNDGVFIPKTIINRKNIMKKYINLYKKGKINILILDEPMVHELKFRGKHFKSPEQSYIYFRNQTHLDSFEKINKQIKNSKNIDILFFNLIDLYDVIGIKNYKRIIKNYYINQFKLGSNIEKRINKESINKDGDKSYLKYYRLKVKYMKKRGEFKKLNNTIKELKEIWRDQQ